MKGREGVRDVVHVAKRKKKKPMSRCSHAKGEERDNGGCVRKKKTHTHTHTQNEKKIKTKNTNFQLRWWSSPQRRLRRASSRPCSSRRSPTTPPRVSRTRHLLLPSFFIFLFFLSLQVKGWAGVLPLQSNLLIIRIGVSLLQIDGKKIFSKSISPPKAPR